MTTAALAAPNPGRAKAAATHVRRLQLSDFRNYRRLDLRCGSGPVVLFGANGAGKTNLLEALSLLGPGRGLRRARLAELDRRGAGPWRITAALDGREGPCEVTTGRLAEGERRRIEVDGNLLSGQSALAHLLGVVWLVPAMDRLFLDGPGPRRRFLDRLTLAIYPDHAGRVAAFERAMAERTHLLRGGHRHAILRHAPLGGTRDPAWLGATERRMAENGVAVAAARRHLVAGLNEALGMTALPFPVPSLRIEGATEASLDLGPAVMAEDRLVEALALARDHDAMTGGASVGPHRSDLVAHDAATGEPAGSCSTGRQKAFLISITLAEARLHEVLLGALPLLLLDEVTAHLDARRRRELLEAIADLGAQTWLSGTDAELFAPLRGRAQLLHVAHGTISPNV